MVFKGHGQLVLETVAPVGVLGQHVHGAHEASLQESLGDVQALQLVHGFDLLLAFGAGIVESLILLLDERDLTLDLLVPLSMIVLLSLLVLLFELSDFLQLSLLFNLQDGLLNRFSQQHVQDWLDLTVVLKQVVVADLCRLVNACLLGHILWRRRFRQELIGLCLHVTFFRGSPSLLGQEVCEINFDAGRGPWPQIVWLRLGLGLLEFEQLLFYHFDLLFLALHLNALLLLLGWRQVLLQKVRIVRVSSEDSLIVHDIEGLTIVILVIIVGVGVVGGSVLELLLLANDLGLGTLKGLSHFSNLLI